LLTQKELVKGDWERIGFPEISERLGGPGAFFLSLLLKVFLSAHTLSRTFPIVGTLPSSLLLIKLPCRRSQYDALLVKIPLVKI